MIKIERTPSPKELTQEVVTTKTASYKADHSIVWREPYILHGLLEMSHFKCCYCECRLDEESKYLEVEHFHCKGKYEDEVVVWDNLLPSCKKCNVQKGDFDTVKQPIIDPTKMEPRDHLSYYNYLLRGKSDIGKTTEEVLNLNDYKRHCLPRFKISIEILKTISDMYDDALMLTHDSSSIIKMRFKNRLIRVLDLCQADEPYTATKATVLANDKKYNEIISILRYLELWREPLPELDATMRRYVLDQE